MEITIGDGSGNIDDCFTPHGGTKARSNVLIDVRKT